MSHADKIGLLPGFGWLAGHNVWISVLLCWAIAPGGLWLCQLLLESTVPTLDPAKNYKSFLPGDLFLGTMVGVMLVLGQHLPVDQRLYNSTWWHLMWFAVMFCVAIVLVYMDWRSGQFTLRELFSPAKLYHSLLYWLYGYIIAVSLLAFIMGYAWSERNILVYCAFVLGIGWGMVWVFLLVQDSSFANAVQNKQTEHSVPEKNEPSWNPVFLPPYELKRL